MDRVDDYSQRTVGKSPSISMGLIVALVILVIVILWQRQKYKNLVSTGGSSTFHSASGSAVTPPPPRDSCGKKVPGFGSGSGPWAACGANWDPSATAEAMALAEAGGLVQENYGEMRLRGAINTAYETGTGLTDDQLAEQMHMGGTP